MSLLSSKNLSLPSFMIKENESQSKKISSNKISICSDVICEQNISLLKNFDDNHEENIVEIKSQKDDIKIHELNIREQ